MTPRRSKDSRKDPVVRIISKKLGREKALGQTYNDWLLEVDPRQAPRPRMDTVVHELVHNLFPEMLEEDVAYTARMITKTLWGDGYRRIYH